MYRNNPARAVLVSSDYPLKKGNLPVSKLFRKNDFCLHPTGSITMTINVSTLFDVALSLVFIFFTFSLFVSGIVEFINTWFDQRSQLLKLALNKIVSPYLPTDYQKETEQTDDGDINKVPVFTQFWNHPLIKIKEQRLFSFNKPISYLSADSFSTVVLDILASASPKPEPLDDSDRNGATNLTLARIRQTVANPNPTGNLANSPTRVELNALARLVAPLLEESDTLAELKTALEHWYDGYMEQVSGWFKRNTQAIVWLVSIIVTIAMNVDTLRISHQLFMDPKLRDSLVKRASEVAAQNPQSTSAGSTSATQKGFTDYLAMYDVTLASSLTAAQVSGKPLSSEDSLVVQSYRLRYLQTTIADLGLPIGWPVKPKGWLEILLLIAGWALTAAALSFGAPFWFDLLVKLVNIRNVAKKPTSSVVPDK